MNYTLLHSVLFCIVLYCISNTLVAARFRPCCTLYLYYTSCCLFVIIRLVVCLLLFSVLYCIVLYFKYIGSGEVSTMLHSVFVLYVLLFVCYYTSCCLFVIVFCIVLYCISNTLVAARFRPCCTLYYCYFLCVCNTFMWQVGICGCRPGIQAIQDQSGNVNHFPKK